MSLPYFDDLIESFLHALRFEKRYSDHTLLAYQNDLNGFFAYLNTHYDIFELATIKPFHIRSWFSEMMAETTTQASSIKRKKSALQSFFKYFIEQEKLKSNPAAVVPTPKLPKRLPKVIEAEAIEKIISLDDYIESKEEWQGKTEKLIIKLLFETGMRRAELTQLSDADIHFGRKEVLVFGKGSKERLIPLHSSTLELIQIYIQERKNQFPEYNNSNLLCTTKGKPIYDKYIFRTVKNFLEIVSQSSKKSPHVLRHTFATELLNNGADISAIKDLLGHASLAATQVYTHTQIGNLQKEFRKSHPRS